MNLQQTYAIKIIKLTIFMLLFCAIIPLMTYAKTALLNNNIDYLPVFYVNSDDIFIPPLNNLTDTETLTDSDTKKVIPGGMTVGIRINTSGVMVVRTDYISDTDGKDHSPSEDILNPGDLIISANGKLVTNAEELHAEILNSDDTIELSIKRDDAILERTIAPIICSHTNENKIGTWVRDSTQGIGTLTYINPTTMKFGALGHGIMDIDTKKLMAVSGGDMWDADVKTIKKGKRGAPGELVGDIAIGDSLGAVRMNNSYGLYGTMDTDAKWLSNEPMPIASKCEVVTGPATILTNIGSDSVSSYEVIIESLNKNSCDNTKGIVIRITDDSLLDKTNGIVQGMSGSPIIQNHKLVGAITHVFVLCYHFLLLVFP